MTSSQPQLFVLFPRLEQTRLSFACLTVKVDADRANRSVRLDRSPPTPRTPDFPGMGVRACNAVLLAVSRCVAWDSAPNQGVDDQGQGAAVCTGCVPPTLFRPGSVCDLQEFWGSNSDHVPEDSKAKRKRGCRFFKVRFHGSCSTFWVEAGD